MAKNDEPFTMELTRVVAKAAKGLPFGCFSLPLAATRRCKFVENPPRGQLFEGKVSNFSDCLIVWQILSHYEVSFGSNSSPVL
jgi:hypothetical protein